MEIESASAKSNPGSAFAVFVGVVALWLFAGATFFLLPLSVMASDGCFEGDARTICTATGQQVVGFLPLMTAPIAAIAGTWGLLASGDKPKLAYVVAIVALVLVWAVVGAITK
ncbi:ACR3 family arsenite efflux pump ArsB [Streptomyces olivoverticillatus]|uniref:ACR3 family arsenite efflux pump ArsB n=1 Tax=Streptomyces olivoverticillatus TaxID=66427 RepID=A0A7W7PK99_9ACTN|nr:hypothetical protein [Streptomyces olivoverticillatus]MBB4892158.1 ACR3 family arsenite efflux pump ArsB [Streptomyces olivoverticillatus]